MLWEEIKRIFGEDTSHPFYWRFHAVFLLVVYELLLAVSKTPYVAVYNGSDLWFAFIHKFVPYGTVIISVPLILYFSLPMYQDWFGIKNRKEQDADFIYLSKGIIPPPKPRYRPDWWAMIRIGIEGLFFGGVLFIFLRWIVFFSANGILEGDFSIPTPIDANPALRNLHTNAIQNIALALGAGFFDEFIFRRWLFPLLEDKSSRYLQSPLFQTIAAIFLSSLIFALSHYLYPFGDSFSTYTVLYRFFFGIIMCLIINSRGFAITAWTHASHDLFYFWLV